MPSQKLAALLEKSTATVKKIRSFSRSLLRGGPILAVDFGSYAIKILLIGEDKGVPQIKSWGYAPLGIAADAAPEERKSKTLSALRALLIGRGLKLNRAAAAVSGNSVLVRYVKFPLLSPSELTTVLPTEAEPFIPFDIAEVQLGFHILGETEDDGQKKMDTVLVAAKKDIVASRVDALQSCGLIPAIIDVDSFAIETLCLRNGSLPRGAGAVLNLNIGHSATNLSIIEGGITRTVRDIFIAGNSITKAIMKELSCDADRAESVKTSCGLLWNAEEKSKALEAEKNDELAASAAVAQVAKDLVSEVHRSVDFYLSQGTDRSIQKILLSGGSAALKNLPQYLSDDLKAPVDMLDPLALFPQKPADFPAGTSSAFAVAAGLALRTLEDAR
ncbi:MAG: type IV pilus assembly protein PilM [Elusimicrobiota bacterium]